MGGIFVSLLLVLSIFTLLSISEVNAEEIISVNAEGYQNTILVEFENESTSKIKTIRMWPSGETTFESFKSEPGWGGGKYSDGELIIFTATNTLNPGESVKFGLVTNAKIDAINWKALDLDNNDIDKGKISINTISETSSDFIEEESKEVEQAKETGGELYGTKKFIPEQILIGGDVRLVGSGFNSEENLKFYLDSTILKSIVTDKEGNFLTTISIPNTFDAGTSEFIIKDEYENIQTTNVQIKEANNRLLKTEKFEVSNIPAEIRYDEMLTISGNAYPLSAIILAFEDKDRVLEKSRVVVVDSNGEWIFEEIIDRTENLGEKYVIIKNNNFKTTKNLNVKTDYLVEIAMSAQRYNAEDIVIVTGTGQPNQNTTILIKDETGKIILYDVFTSDPDGGINYEFQTDNTIITGTYTVIVKQESGSDATFFGIGKYPSAAVTTLLDQTNFTLNSKAMLSIIGPPSSKISIKILDSNDNIKISDSITTSSAGKSRYTVDLDGLSSGIYRAAVSAVNIQASIKFSVGLEPGSGDISLIAIQENYSPGDSILVLGYTGFDARITITLYDPAGNVSSITETFSDGAGNFSTSEIGIPINAEFGTWKITAHSKLDTKTINVNVSLPTENTLVFDLDETVFNTGNTVMIKGIAQSDSSRLQIIISDEDGDEVTMLETPITSDGTFSLPWTIPNGIDVGTYTITISDSENSSSIEIFIE